MIYLFCGDDTKNKISSYEKFVKLIPSGTEISFINRNEFNPIQIESFYSGSSLFSILSAVIFQDILGYEENRDFILEKLELMGNSTNSFIFLEMLSPTPGIFPKSGEILFSIFSKDLAALR